MDFGINHFQWTRKPERYTVSDDRVEIVIPGGNHACFGSYGPQSGDGKAFISPAEQIRFTAEAIAEFVQKSQHDEKCACSTASVCTA